MAEYESRKVRGWRSLLEDAVVNARERICAAPAWVVYIEGIEPCRSDQLPGSTKWFNRVFGPERAVACAELVKIQQIKQQIRKAEMTVDQLEEIRAKWREKYYKRKAKLTDEARLAQLKRKRAKRAKRTPEEIENERAWFRQWRAKQSDEWRREQAKKKRQRCAAKPELYKAIDQRSNERNRDSRNERRRLAYKANPEKYLTKSRAYKAAKRKRLRANRPDEWFQGKALPRSIPAKCKAFRQGA